MKNPIRSMLPDTIQLPMPDIRQPFNESEMSEAAEDLIALRLLEEAPDKSVHNIDVTPRALPEGKPMRATRQQIDEALQEVSFGPGGGKKQLGPGGGKVQEKPESPAAAVRTATKPGKAGIRTLVHQFLPKL